MTRPRALFLCISALVTACGGREPLGEGGEDDDPTGEESATSGGEETEGESASDDTGWVPPDSMCGDGVVERGEFCDVEGADGCRVCHLDDVDGIQIVLGAEIGDESGVTVSPAGDVDGDGLDDFLVGVPEGDPLSSSGGYAVLILGAEIAAIEAGATSGLGLDLGRRLLGTSEGESAGAAVASAGDVDGDGRADILVGAPGYSESALDAGAVYLVLASDLATGDEDLGLSGASYRIVGPPNLALESVGFSVSSAGDVDGDGLDDLLFGAFRSSISAESAGTAYLVWASALLARPPGSTVEALDVGVAFTGEKIGDALGFSVAPAGDIDGDGAGDLLVGASAGDVPVFDAGTTYIISGASLGQGPGAVLDISGAATTALGGAAQGANAGTSVSAAGDVDGDGLADLIVGAPGYGEDKLARGAAYILPGSLLAAQGGMATLSVDAGIELVGTNSSDRAGTSVAGGFDVDGDGLDDVLVGAPGVDTEDADPGGTYIIFGRDLEGRSPGSQVDLSSASVTFLGYEPGGSSGASVAFAGDVDGDGLSELLIGAPTVDGLAMDSGATYLLMSPY